VLIVAAIAFSPRTSRLFPLNLGVAERRALLLMAVDALLLRADIDERQHARPGQQRGAAGQLRQQQPAHPA
jgi:hypothetical protein